MFHILLISLFSYWYLSIFPFTVLQTPMPSGIVISIIAKFLSFLFITTISSFLSTISLSYWIKRSQKFFNSAFSTRPSGTCSYQFSFLFRLYFRHNFQWTILAKLCLPLHAFCDTFHFRSKYEIFFHFLLIYCARWWLGSFIYLVFHIVSSNYLLLQSTKHGFCFNFQVSFSQPVPCFFFVRCFWNFSYKLFINSFVFP